jgi:hypothetical protein
MTPPLYGVMEEGIHGTLRGLGEGVGGWGNGPF